MFVLSIFLTSGDAPGFAGEAVGDGDATGDATATGLAVATGAGVVGGLFGAGGVVHAPKTATDAAKIVDNIIDLLIVFLLDKKVAPERRWPLRFFLICVLRTS